MVLARGTLSRRIRRNRMHIIAEVLEASKIGLTKTQIMYKASLSFPQVDHYLSFLLELNLIQKIKTDERTIYKITKKGIKFLRSYQEIKELLKPISTL